MSVFLILYDSNEMCCFRLRCENPSEALSTRDRIGTMLIDTSLDTRDTSTSADEACFDCVAPKAYVAFSLSLMCVDQKMTNYK